MYIQFEPNVKATIAFLKFLKVRVNNATVNETLQNHPDWPSLLSIGDSLSKWGISNGAGYLPMREIDQLPVPFFANIHNDEYPMAIVSYVDEHEVHYYLKDYLKKTIDTRSDFNIKWTGIYLIAERNEESGEKDYVSKKRQALQTKLVPFLLFLTLIASSFRWIYSSALPTFVYLQYSLSILGVAVTTLLVWYEIDKSNPVLQKVCTGIAKGNCNAILTGKHAKLFPWLSWSEIGLFYFTGCTIGLLTLTNFIYIFSWLAILALPYTLFSVYIQWRVAKQWCVLCLLVQALLLLQTLNVIANELLKTEFNGLQTLTIIIIYAVPALVWFTIKPYFLTLQEAKNTKRQYLRLKFNAEIFDNLLKKQKAITIPTDGIGIDLGKADARNVIIKVCNPYCNPCARAHPEIDKLLVENPDIRVKIIFTANNTEGNTLAKPVKHLMAIADKNDERIMRHALDDWYLADKKDYSIFAKKYPMNGELLQQDTKVDAMRKWVDEVGVRFTPTIFINGYQLPDAYNIADLQYFLLE
jgi:uncharacterized membrane protein